MVKLIIAVFVFWVAYVKCDETSRRANEAPIVTLNYGKIKGIQDTNASLYLGIPYAQPPVKNLRWKDPVDTKPWKPAILDATDFKPSCPQRGCTPVSACPNIVYLFFKF